LQKKKSKKSFYLPLYLTASKFTIGLFSILVTIILIIFKYFCKELLDYNTGLISFNIISIIAIILVIALLYLLRGTIMSLIGKTFNWNNVLRPTLKSIFFTCIYLLSTFLGYVFPLILAIAIDIYFEFHIFTDYIAMESDEEGGFEYIDRNNLDKEIRWIHARRSTLRTDLGRDPTLNELYGYLTRNGIQNVRPHSRLVFNSLRTFVESKEGEGANPQLTVEVCKAYKQFRLSQNDTE
jgi:hypothetical protein